MAAFNLNAMSLEAVNVPAAPETIAVAEEDEEECLHAQLRWLQRELSEAQSQRDALQMECQNVMVARAETERCLYYAFLEVKALRSRRHAARPTRQELATACGGEAMLEPRQLPGVTLEHSGQLRLEAAHEKQQCLSAQLEDLERELVVTLVERDELESERTKQQSALDDAERSLQEAFKEVTALRS